MAESSLSLGYADLRSAIGRFLGYTRTAGSWTTQEADDIAEVLASGLRQFYAPPPLGDGRMPHSWSFLKPLDSIATVADDYDYDMDDDFGGIEGSLTFNPDDGYADVPIVGEGQIRTKRQTDSATTGRPVLAAVRWKSTDQTDGQRAELLLWPTPDGVYTLSFRKLVLIDNISAAAPYPPGGMLHAEAIKQSCLAAAELFKDDARGVQWEKFMERLAASVALDQRQGREAFGYNADRSDREGAALSERRVNYTTYNGVHYGV